jgi:hypothetical protein
MHHFAADANVVVHSSQRWVRSRAKKIKHSFIKSMAAQFPFLYAKVGEENAASALAEALEEWKSMAASVLNTRTEGEQQHLVNLISKQLQLMLSWVSDPTLKKPAEVAIALELGCGKIHIVVCLQPMQPTSAASKA